MTDRALLAAEAIAKRIDEGLSCGESTLSLETHLDRLSDVLQKADSDRNRTAAAMRVIYAHYRNHTDHDGSVLTRIATRLLQLTDSPGERESAGDALWRATDAFAVAGRQHQSISELLEADRLCSEQLNIRDQRVQDGAAINRVVVQVDIYTLFPDRCDPAALLEAMTVVVGRSWPTNDNQEQQLASAIIVLADAAPRNLWKLTLKRLSIVDLKASCVAKLDEHAQGIPEERTSRGRLDQLRLTAHQLLCANGKSEDGSHEEWSGYLTMNLIRRQDEYALSPNRMQEALDCYERALGATGYGSERYIRCLSRISEIHELLEDSSTDGSHQRSAMGAELQLFALQGQGESDRTAVTNASQRFGDWSIQQGHARLATEQGVRAFSSAALPSLMVQAVCQETVARGRRLDIVVWLATNDRLPSGQEPSAHFIFWITPTARLELIGAQAVDALLDQPQVVQLRALDAGEAEVRVECLADGVSVGSISFAIDIIELVSSARSVAAPIESLTSADLVVVARHDAGTLTYTASSVILGLNLMNLGQIDVDGQAVEAIRSRLRNLHPFESLDSPEAAKDLDFELRTLGGLLSDRLVTEKLRSLLLRARGEVSSLLIQGDNFWVPWEILLLEDGGTPQFLCESFDLTQWRIGVPFQRELRLSDIGLVAPASLNFSPEAEKTSLRQLAVQHGWQVHEAQTSARGLIDDLGEKNWKCWHFITHGVASQISGVDSLVLQMDGSRDLEVGDLTTTRCRKLQQTRPFFFLNACQTGVPISGLSGTETWSRRLLDHGAGAVLATLWPVSNTAAATFSDSVFRSLSQGSTLPRAVRNGRSTVRENCEQDSSWLAYTLFSDPHAGIVT